MKRRAKRQKERIKMMLPEKKILLFYCVSCKFVSIKTFLPLCPFYLLLLTKREVLRFVCLPLRRWWRTTGWTRVRRWAQCGGEIIRIRVGVAALQRKCARLRLEAVKQEEKESGEIKMIDWRKGNLYFKVLCKKMKHINKMYLF